MRILGLEITRTKAMTPASSRGWFPLVSESSAGAWQRDEPLQVETGLSHSAVFACAALVANDVAKLPVRVNRWSGAVWIEDAQHPAAALLRRPNGYQTRFQFVQSMLLAKLLHGNAYALIERGPRGEPVRLHPLNSTRVQVLVSDQGEVFYRLQANDLAQIRADITVPAREIVHDRGLCPFHPLIGVSPLTAAASSTRAGLAILKNSAAFFDNGARPGGLLTAPGQISAETAARLKEHWEANYTGNNAGRTAVLGDGLKYEAMSVNPVDAQLVEQLGYSAADIARAFGVPAYKIGIGQAPPYTGLAEIQNGYYSDCLQHHLESLELALDAALGLDDDEQIEFDTRALIRLDYATQISAAAAAVNAGLLTTNEARADLGRPPVEGGDLILRQLQDVPLTNTNDSNDDPETAQ